MLWKTKARQDDDRISTLESRVRTLEANIKALDSEWTEMYDKFRRLHMRLSKRDQREGSTPQEPAGATNGAGAGVPPHTMNPLALKLLGGME